MKKIAALLMFIFLGQLNAAESAHTQRVRADIDAMYPDIERLYIDLHRNPELSMLEEKTAAKLAERMRKLGYEVTSEGGWHRRRRACCATARAPR